MLTRANAPRGLTYFTNVGPHLLTGAFLGLAAVLWIWMQSHTLFSGWSLYFSAIAGLAGHDALVVLSRSPDFLVNVYLQRGPGPLLPGVYAALALSAVLLAWSYLTHPDKVPAKYAQRIFAFFIGVPALALWVQGDYAMNLAAHVASVFKLGYWFLLVLPVLYTVTAFILPGNIARKMLAVCVALLFHVLCVPVLATIHLVILSAMGPAWLPVLNVFGTVFLMAFHAIAFYGWMASLD